MLSWHCGSTFSFSPKDTERKRKCTSWRKVLQHKPPTGALDSPLKASLAEQCQQFMHNVSNYMKNHAVSCMFYTRTVGPY